MTATILVIDDLLPNVKLLETKLVNEYYDVLTAMSGAEGLTILKQKQVDLILLDVMMPEMDGFEVCQIIKNDPDLTHVPVVMVTALSEVEDRVSGLESGADDFLTKPINDLALFARIRSLVRIKKMIDELRLRDQSRSLLGVKNEDDFNISDLKDSSILLIDDDIVENKNLRDKLLVHFNSIDVISDPSSIINDISEKSYDLFVVSGQMTDHDGLRVCSQLKAQKTIRHIPCLLMVEEGDNETIARALDIGVSDYIATPVDVNEMLARSRSQIKRKRYQEALMQNYQDSINMSLTDSLTGIYNRRYFDVHSEKLAQTAKDHNKELSIIILDIDFFKQVNDNYGHVVGDEILKQFAKIIMDSVRITDLVSRYGGEEFIVLLPDTKIDEAKMIAERIRENIDSFNFMINDQGESVQITSSLGVANYDFNQNFIDSLKAADAKLYEAKEQGRNRVC